MPLLIFPLLYLPLSLPIFSSLFLYLPHFFSLLFFNFYINLPLNSPQSSSQSSSNLHLHSSLFFYLTLYYSPLLSLPLSSHFFLFLSLYYSNPYSLFHLLAVPLPCYTYFSLALTLSPFLSPTRSSSPILIPLFASTLIFPYFLLCVPPFYLLCLKVMLPRYITFCHPVGLFCSRQNTLQNPLLVLPKLA